MTSSFLEQSLLIGEAWVESHRPMSKQLLAKSEYSGGERVVEVDDRDRKIPQFGRGTVELQDLRLEAAAHCL
jgi:uncharacterized membrane-anchored protein